MGGLGAGLSQVRSLEQLGAGSMMEGGGLSRGELQLEEDDPLESLSSSLSLSWGAARAAMCLSAMLLVKDEGFLGDDNLSEDCLP